MSKVTLNPLECALDEAQALRRQVDALQAENTKLRKLAARLIACVDSISNSDTFYCQPMRDGCGIDCTANGEHCSLAKMCGQARELGVEVE